jgi:hypothetical protein
VHSGTVALDSAAPAGPRSFTFVDDRPAVERDGGSLPRGYKYLGDTATSPSPPESLQGCLSDRFGPSLTDRTVKLGRLSIEVSALQVNGGGAAGAAGGGAAAGGAIGALVGSLFAASQGTRWVTVEIHGSVDDVKNFYGRHQASAGSNVSREEVRDAVQRAIDTACGDADPDLWSKPVPPIDPG